MTHGAGSRHFAAALEAAVDAGGRRQSALEQSSQALDTLLLRLTDVTVFNQIEQSANRFAAAVEATGTKVAAAGDHLGAYAASIGGMGGAGGKRRSGRCPGLAG